MSLPPDLVRKACSRLPAILSRLATDGVFEAFELPLPKASRAKDDADLLALHRDAKLLEEQGFHLRREQVRSRTLGQQTVPFALEIRTIEDLGRLTGDRHLHRFAHLSRAAIRRLPGLSPFWREHPLDAWAQRGRWSQIARALEWFRDHPSSALRARQIPWALHGKFVEQNGAVLRRLLPLVATVAPTDSDMSLEAMAGLQSRQALWRVRLLDPRLLPSLPARDLALSLEDWMRILPSPRRAIAVENLESFLALGERTDTIAIWGSGFAVVRLCAWLAHSEQTWYWGDLDAQGFEILDVLRREAPAVKSVAMHSGVLRAHPNLASPGNGAIPRELKHLDRAEWSAYRQVVDGNLRLEQEKLPMRWVESELDRVLGYPV